MAAQTAWLEKDYYEVLGVPETASDKDIQRAYRRLARQHHPDANPGDPKAEERFKDISAAYDVIGDAEKRKEYDELRRLGPLAGGGGGGGGAGEPFTIRIEDLGDFGDLGDFQHLFGGGFGWGGGRPAGPRRGPDLETELHLDFQEAVSGVTTDVRGAGDTPVRVRVPAGIEDGQLIRVPERGGPGRNGGPPGDLFVHVRIRPHPLFGRRGRDLTLTVPITYPEAVLGAEVKVPTLDGGPVTLRVPAGTPSGRTLRVRGRGVPTPQGRGDLLVTVEVAVPRHPSDEERRAVQALAGAMPSDPRARLGV